MDGASEAVDPSYEAVFGTGESVVLEPLGETVGAVGGKGKNSSKGAKKGKKACLPEMEEPPTTVTVWRYGRSNVFKETPELRNGALSVERLEHIELQLRKEMCPTQERVIFCWDLRSHAGGRVTWSTSKGLAAAQEPLRERPLNPTKKTKPHLAGHNLSRPRGAVPAKPPMPQ